MKETNRKKKTMQETITKYQSKFNRLMTSIEKDKILKKMPGNATAGIAVQMIKSLKSYLKANKAWDTSSKSMKRVRKSRIKKQCLLRNC